MDDAAFGEDGRRTDGSAHGRVFEGGDFGGVAAGTGLLGGSGGEPGEQKGRRHGRPLGHGNLILAVRGKEGVAESRRQDGHR